MADPNDEGKGQDTSRLGRILREHPEARPKLVEAVGGLLKVVLATVAIVGVLAIWHLRRRAQLIRDRLGPPRDVCLEDVASDERPDDPASAPGNPRP